MNFANINDLILFFANEYCVPGNTILILGNCDSGIKKIFEFIDCTTIFVNTVKGDADIVSEYHDLPFEEHSFDSILNFSNFIDVYTFIKPAGYILLKGEILNGLDYYTHRNQVYTVLN